MTTAFSIACKMLEEVTLCLLRLCGGCILGLHIGCLLLLTGIIHCTSNRASLLRLSLYTCLCMLLHQILPMQLQHLDRLDSRPNCVRHHTPQISILQNTARRSRLEHRHLAETTSKSEVFGLVRLILPREQAFEGPLQGILKRCP